MQNECVLFATLMLGFRAHTRVLATLPVALIIAFLGLTGGIRPAALVPAQPAENTEAHPELSLEPASVEPPQTVIRFLFLLPHLMPDSR